MNLRQVILIVVLSVSFSAAAKDYNFACSTSAGLTNSVLVEDRGDKIVTTWIHHNGMEFAPIYGGIIAARDLPVLNTKASLLSLLPEIQTYEFDKSKCSSQGDFLVYCVDFHGAVQTVQG